jgi:hypothetical protein
MSHERNPKIENLELNKETVQDLTEAEAQDAQGGIFQQSVPPRCVVGGGGITSVERTCPHPTYNVAACNPIAPEWPRRPVPGPSAGMPAGSLLPVSTCCRSDALAWPPVEVCSSAVNLRRWECLRPDRLPDRQVGRASASLWQQVETGSNLAPCSAARHRKGQS